MIVGNNEMVYGSQVSLVFPHQLFLNHPALTKERTVILVEEWLFFSQYQFHKIKLAYHRASMQAYKKHLATNGYTCRYIEATDANHDVRQLISLLAEKQVQALHLTEVHDDWLQKRIVEACAAHRIKIIWYASPMFLADIDTYHEFFNQKKKYFQTDFYIWQRKRLGLLLEADKKPMGGKWTFDTENRKPYPKNGLPPIISFPAVDDIQKEAWQYVAAHFHGNPGKHEELLYPTTHAAAVAWLQDFLSQRFSRFGDYEDAMMKGEHFLHHSVLTPMLNTGLLTPMQVLDATLAYAADNEIGLHNIEGFIRQIAGWREFIMSVYLREGSRQRTTNYWGFSKKIPQPFYEGNTGIAPIDDAIQKLLETGYNHHIERLMILGNFFLLCEFDPNAVYRWFMELYIDAYDWVMVPNVYGMTQFADGGLMTTKPYISGSNYIIKMSNYPKGDWQAIWDGLFWRFMHVHRVFFEQNPRLGMLLRTWDKMAESKRNIHLRNAEQYLNTLSE